MCITISAFFAFHLEPFAAGDTADIFFGIECIAVVARNEVRRARLSPWNPIPLIADRPDEEIERQTYQRCQKRNHQYADDLQRETIGPVNDILGSPYDDNNSEKDKENSAYIYPKRDTACIEERR